MATLVDLVELDVSSCHLTALPDIFDNMRALTTLNARNNMLVELPRSICSLTALRALDVRNNELARLPKKIGSLSTLQRLYVAQNLLESLPSSIGALQVRSLTRTRRHRYRQLASSPCCAGVSQQASHRHFSSCTSRRISSLSCRVPSSRSLPCARSRRITTPSVALATTRQHSQISRRSCCSTCVSINSRVCQRRLDN